MESALKKHLCLSNRLKAIANLVSGNIAADVGCDHAYLSIFLAMHKCDYVYATDVREKPLERAKENIKRYGVENKIKLILTDGLCNVPQSVDTVIVSGMGGKLIERIVFEQDWLKNKDKHLILQPQTFLMELRQNLYLNGYEIEFEYPIIEFDKSYCVVSARYSGRVKNISLKDAVVGRIKDSNSKYTSEFFMRRYKKYRKVLDGLCISGVDKQKIDKYEKICNILSEWK